MIRFDTVKENKHSLLAEQVAERINQYILDHNLRPGEKLPNEFELCEQFGIGRGTVREAVKILIARNVLTIRRGAGTFISEQTGVINDPLGFEYLTDKVALATDLLEIRLQMEPWIASIAAERATQEDLDLMVAQREKVEQLINQKINHLEEDKKFHECIANCTHNAVIPKLIPIITYSVSLFGSLSNNKLVQETTAQHRIISDAICNKDPEAARQGMLEHILSNKIQIDAMKKV